MERVASFEIFAADLPFRKPFKHAAAERSTSSSIFVKCVTESGKTGFGECLPREYVTGETRDGAYDVLRDKMLPRLIGMEFGSMEDVTAFLVECNGKAPKEWLDPQAPQCAAWCAVDLALLDAFGRAFGVPARVGSGEALSPDFRYSAVVSAEPGLKALSSLLKIRLYGFRQAKLKVGAEGAVEAARLTRRVLGRRCDIRADANMAWTVENAPGVMRSLATLGITSFEQPLAADDLDGLARLVEETGLDVMVDESITDDRSLERLIEKKACTAVNIRISKCGGLVASHARCREALEAGLKVQIGCQVGESSLLSAAHMALVGAVGQVTYGEGCFGLILLREDPGQPVVQFGYGGRPPPMPGGAGLGVTVDEPTLRRWAARSEVVEASPSG